MGTRDFEIGEPVVTADGGARLSVRVPLDLGYFDGHFPGRPIVPGVAQVVLVERAARGLWPDLGAPVELRRLKFLETIGPGDELVLELRREGDAVRYTLARDGVACSRGALAWAGR